MSEVELETIRHTLKRMETVQSYIKNYLVGITVLLGLIVMKFVLDNAKLSEVIIR